MVETVIYDAELGYRLNPKRPIGPNRFPGL